jgi:cob(I)alamin adenosyltransferase
MCGDLRIYHKSLCIEGVLTGYVQVYTGLGKGKTTAALGLCLRAAGAGLSVYVGQFMKSGEFSEIHALERFSDLISVKQYGTPGFVFGSPTPEDISAAESGATEIKAALASGSYNMVVMDEINVAIHYGLVSVGQIVELIESRPLEVEIVLTGRHAHPDILAIADLVTEMQPVKHYYDKGVHARTGIER